MEVCLHINLRGLLNHFYQHLMTNRFNLVYNKILMKFLSILSHSLEKEAKSYNKENFLENSFKGKISNEILSLEK